MVDKAIIVEIRQYLARIAEAGIPVVSAVLFGSFAKGEQRAESDIDVLVLSPSFDGGVDFDTVNELWRLTRQVDARIEPHPVGVREFEDDEGSPLIGIARREGVVIPFAAAGVVREERAGYEIGGKKSPRMNSATQQSVRDGGSRLREGTTGPIGRA